MFRVQELFLPVRDVTVPHESKRSLNVEETGYFSPLIPLTNLAIFSSQASINDGQFCKFGSSL